jgi:hypothetical protein
MTTITAQLTTPDGEDELMEAGMWWIWKGSRWSS